MDVMPNPTRRSGTPFDEEVADQKVVVEDEEDLPGHPPRQEGSPLADPDRAPGSPPDAVPPGPGSPE
jgi:hypothetical protein